MEQPTYRIPNSEVCDLHSDSSFYSDFSEDSSEFSNKSSYLYEDDVVIPKIIMQTWKDHNIPPKWKVSPKSIQDKMPDWEYILMTDDDNRNFVKKHFPDFLRYYDAFPHDIQRVDAIRYMWLYINGGIYIDLDYEVLHPLDDLFKGGSNVYLVSSSNVGSYLTNSFMASKPRCKLWLEMIEAMKKDMKWYIMGRHLQVMNSTGPIRLTHVVKKSKHSYTMLPGKLILPCSVCNLDCKSEGSWMRQLEGSSWIAWDTKFYNFWMCNWKKVIAFLVILIILLLIVIFILWMSFTRG